MERPPLWKRGIGRAQRAWEGRAHASADRALLARIPSLLAPDEEARLVDRLRRRPGEGPLPADPQRRDESGDLLPVDLRRRVEERKKQDPLWETRLARAAAPLLRDELDCIGGARSFADPRSWNLEPSRPRAWPVRAHASILLNDPRTPGDVRLAWEPARFHHAPALGRYWLASGDPAAVEAFLRQTRSFEVGNPPFETIHWAVGMEVGIRAAAWVLALEFFRGAPELSEEESRRLLQGLLRHGAFLEAHPDRHPHGFTTNHALAAAAGLGLIGRFLDGAVIGEAWRKLAAERMAECLRSQVLEGGAHAEGALPYERFVLEAGLVGFLALTREERGPLCAPLASLARHLAAARLPSGLPFIGDGDDSCFPPFGMAPWSERNPLDPEGALQTAEVVLGLSGLRERRAVEEPAFWFGAEEVRARSESAGDSGAGAGLTVGSHIGDSAAGGTRGPRIQDLPAGPTVGSDIGDSAGDTVGTHLGDSAAGGPGRPRIIEHADVAPTVGSHIGDSDRWIAEQRGIVRFRSGAFEGCLVARSRDEGMRYGGWLPTHEHNDLLSLVLDAAGAPLFVDPGCHGYAIDRSLRNQLRSTAAHSTLQFEDQEQSPLSPRYLFLGPASVPGGRRPKAGRMPRFEAWHDGFRDPQGDRAAMVRHLRRIVLGSAGHGRDALVILDRLIPQPDPDAGPVDPVEGARSTIRFRFAPGLNPVLHDRSLDAGRKPSDSGSPRPYAPAVSQSWRPDAPSRPDALSQTGATEPLTGAPLDVAAAGSRQGGPSDRVPKRASRSCRVPLPGGDVEILLLRPRNASWQIGAGIVSNRYGVREEAAILQGTTEGPWDRGWCVVLRFVPSARALE